jgi:heptaprenylglyceryl phosphate synthase
VILVGGGIRDGETAHKAVEAGADWIVTGNLTEEFAAASALQTTLERFIATMRA